MDITVLTTTYNRVTRLTDLYNTLLNQTDLNFRWLIVDDGSKDETEKIVNGWMDLNPPFAIEYYKKVNGGKSRAVNFGLNKIDSGFVIIIDDDEHLYKNAIELVKEYANKYYSTNCGGMEFLRNDLNKKPIANYSIKDDFFMSVCSRKKKNYEIDGYAGYYIDKIKGTYFPEFDNERYVGPGVLQMLVDQKYDLLWPKVALGETEYLSDGITKAGRKLRLNSPKSMIFYCSLLQKKESGVKIRLKYSIMGYAYAIFSHLKLKSLKEQKVYINKFLKIAYFPGVALALIWKIKY